MADFQNIFQRYELKYLISKTQRDALREEMRPYLDGDEFGKSTICNLYFDTSDYRLIRKSLEKPVYKEKLRLRSYGVASPNSTAFVELKKKYKSVVYKRRVSASYKEAMRCLLKGTAPGDSQISREIDYFLSRYHPSPAVFLSYEREAFYSKTDRSFRITFDENILWRNRDLSLCQGVYGSPILSKGQTLLEVKTAAAIPLWLVSFLSRHQIYKTSFSKYGHAYQQILEQNRKGERKHVS